MNFDRLAPHYGWMELAFAGPLMQRCRTQFLTEGGRFRRALLVGEGRGRFLLRLMRTNPDVRITCVEKSGAMIRCMLAKIKKSGLDPSRVDFQQMDALDWRARDGRYDLLATHFFLDCFPAETLEGLVMELAASASPGATWLVSDFRVPDRGWRKWRARALLRLLYDFFWITTGLSARSLVPPGQYLRKAGFRLEERRLENAGFAYSERWTLI